MQMHTVAGGGDLKLHVREWGPPDGHPILFIHGWSQHHQCWSKQFDGPLSNDFHVVAMDIRGHGQSEAPLSAESYTNGALWADDVKNVIDSLKLDAPVLVGWSYAGFIISDYLRRYGDDSIAGINFVGAAIGIGPRWFGTFIGPGLLDYAPLACSEDQAVALKAIQGFLHASHGGSLATDDLERAMGWNMLVHPQVRAHLIAREDDFTADLAKVKKPVLVTYGDADIVVQPPMAKAIEGSVPSCQVSEYAGVGHLPFLEDPDRFNAELDAFTRQCVGSA